MLLHIVRVDTIQTPRGSCFGISTHEPPPVQPHIQPGQTEWLLLDDLLQFHRMMAPISVLIVGAGPVGLLTTLRLAQVGIEVKCVEALAAIDDSPRAMAYQPVATKELDRAGILDDIRKRGGSSGRGICV
jgi:hypothetical protein